MLRCKILNQLIRSVQQHFASSDISISHLGWILRMIRLQIHGRFNCRLVDKSLVLCELPEQLSPVWTSCFSQVASSDNKLSRFINDVCKQAHLSANRCYNQ